MSCLYILEINPFSVVSFAIIFCHSEGCLLILFIVSFAVQKQLSLIRFHLFIFVFIFITLGCGSKKILLWFMSKCVLPVFSSKGLTFRSSSHFEFIFVYGVTKCSSFILLQVVDQFSQLLLLPSHFSRVQLVATPWIAAHQAPPSMGFSRQEYWSGVPSPSP